MELSKIVTERERVVRWEDPLPAAKEIVAVPGIEALKAILEGQHPPAPVQELVGFDLVEVTPGSVAFEFLPAEYHFNPIGSVHGGIASLLLDSAMGASVHSLLPAGVGYTTLELKVNLVRAIQPQVGKLRAQGKVIHQGRKVMTVEAKLRNEEDVLFAHSTSTCLVLGG